MSTPHKLHGLAEVRATITPALVFAVIFGSLGSLTFAYDNGWWGSALGQKAFNVYYGQSIGTDGKPTLSSIQQSCGTALGTAGIMLGCMIAPDFSRRYGRRWSFVALGIVAIVGSIIQATSVVGDRTVASKWWQLVVGKIIVNSSVGVASAVVPTYLGEVAPSNIRGLVVNVYTAVQYVGSVLATGTMYGLQHRTDQLPWILPIGLQMVIPAIMILGTPLLPESPRWLVETNQLDRAVDSMRRLRVAGFDSEREINDLSAAMRHHEEIAGGTSYVDLFRRKGGNLRRTLIVLSMGCLQQGQGISAVNNYLVVILQSMKIKDVIGLLLIFQCAQLVFNLLVSALGPDRLGRRPLLITGAAAMGTSMLIVGGISAARGDNLSGAEQKVIIAAFVIWMLMFGISWGPVCWTVTAETPSAALREKSIAAGAWSGYAVGLIVNLVQPYLANPEYGNLGGMTQFIYGAFSPVAIVWVWFMVPEFKGRHLEQLDEMFEAGVPTRDFPKYECQTTIRGEGGGNPETQDAEKGMTEYKDDRE